MSEDTDATFGPEAVEVTRYRFGVSHAATLIAAVLLLIAASSALYALQQVTGEPGVGNAGERAVAFVAEHPDNRISAAELFQQPADPAPLAWERAKDLRDTLLDEVKRSLNDARRIQNEKVVNQAFAELDQSDPRQARAFLATYKGNAYAEEVGYLAAVERAITEHRLYRPGDVVRCGKCWCYREKPASVHDAAATQ